MVRDFTVRKYQEMCRSIEKSGYKTITVSDYLKNNSKYDNSKFIIIRHDIDNKVDLPTALKMAEYEKSLGIRATYYFRMVRDTYDTELIKTIYNLNHEVGYHYEVLNESKGDINKAVDLFTHNLDEFRKLVPVTSICQHGGSLGDDTASSVKGMLLTSWKLLRGKKELIAYRSNDIWQHEKYEDYNLLGEAYLSLDFDKILYLSDTGLSWDGYENRVLDVINTDYYKEKKQIVRTTDDLINLINKGQYSKINLLVHPANWIDPLIPWLKWRSLQYFRNYGKRIFIKPS